MLNTEVFAPTNPQHRRHRRRVWVWAGVAAVVLGVVFWYVRIPPPPPPTIELPSDSITTVDNGSLGDRLSAIDALPEIDPVAGREPAPTSNLLDALDALDESLPEIDSPDGPVRTATPSNRVEALEQIDTLPEIAL